MKMFSIDADNNITALARAEQATGESQVFSTETELDVLAKDWPLARLADVWNSFAGVAPFGELKPVKKFENRTKAISRIWRAIQLLGDGASAEPLETASVGAHAGKAALKARKPKKGTTAKTARDVARPKAAKAAKAGDKGEARGKKAEVIEMMRRKDGATLPEIMKATGWQAHTVRGFVAGTCGTKMGLNVESFKNKGGDRTYRIVGRGAGA
jgi:uncharacterized protein DUF3489